MAEVLTPDICVIGAGSGGLSVAAAAAAFGVPVVLIEKGKMGGDCLNYGCVPSKALIAAGKRAPRRARAGAFGISAARRRSTSPRCTTHVHGVIAAIAPNDSKERFTGLGVRVIEGAARFKDARTVVVGDIEIKARRFVIATGSSPAVPPIPGLDDDALSHQRDDLRPRRSCPEHLIVIGGGPIGLELAQAFRRLGAEVTVLEAATPLAKDDPECAAIVLGAARARRRRDPRRRRRSRASSARRRQRAGRRSKARRGDASRAASAGRDRPAAERRRARSRGGRHRVRAARHRGRQGAADHQPAGLCDRRRRGRAAIHPCRRTITPAS